MVRDLNLAVHAGEVVAVLGNGAGKTTTLFALAGELLSLACRHVDRRPGSRAPPRHGALRGSTAELADRSAEMEAADLAA